MIFVKMITNQSDHDYYFQQLRGILENDGTKSKYSYHYQLTIFIRYCNNLP